MINRGWHWLDFGISDKNEKIDCKKENLSNICILNNNKMGNSHQNINHTTASNSISTTASNSIITSASNGNNITISNRKISISSPNFNSITINGHKCVPCSELAKYTSVNDQLHEIFELWCK